MDQSLSVIVLTYNEEMHLSRCLESVKDIALQIIVVDSGSTDRTVEIAKSFGADISTHEFRNQAEQFNWALENADIKGDWILRLDADEYLLQELAGEIKDAIENASPDMAGFYMKRRVVFMGRWIKHGGYYPTWILRLFRKGKGKSEEREMDEHIVVEKGNLERLKNDFVDENLNNLYWWTEKHNKFSTREVEVRENIKKNFALEGDPLGEQTERKRWFKENVFMRFPPFLRSFLYFEYRYVLRLGMLDGKEGLIFHFLQGFWYRFLVDAKLYETTKNHGSKD